MQEFENNQIENDYITYTYTKKKKISVFLIAVMMLSIIFSFPHIHAEAAISSVSSSTCPDGGSVGPVGNVGCSYCGGTGADWTGVKGHTSQGSDLSRGYGYQIGGKQGEDEYYISYYIFRCENCGDEGYDCKHLDESVGTVKIHKTTGERIESFSGASPGPGTVPIRQCSKCAPILHGAGTSCAITCYSVAAWAVPHVKPAVKYTITVNANPTNGGTTSGSGTYEEGSTVTISATAKTGYVFDGWSDGNTSSSRSITVSSDKTYTAKFRQGKYTVSASASNSQGGSTTGSGEYTVGTSATVEAIANDGWRFAHWNISRYGKSETSHNATITVSSNDDGTIISCIAVFLTATPTPTNTPTPKPGVEVKQYTITVNADPEKGGTVGGGGKYNENSEISIYATANSGYVFQKWSDGNTNASRKVKVTGDKTYTAKFVTPSPTPTPASSGEGEKTYTVYTSADPAEGGSASGDGTYKVGISANIIATANPGWTFVKWNYTKSSSSLTYVNNNADATVKSDKVGEVITCVAKFEKSDNPPITLPPPSATPTPVVSTSSSSYSATITIDPNGGKFNNYPNSSSINIYTSSWSTTTTTTTFDGNTSTSYSSGTSSGHSAKGYIAHREPYKFLGYGQNADWKNPELVFNAEGNPTNSKFFDSYGYSKFGLSGNYTIYAIWRPPMYDLHYLAPTAQGTMVKTTIEHDKTAYLRKNLFTKPYVLNYNLNTQDKSAILHSNPQITVYAPFLGWAKTENGEVVFSDEQRVTHSIFPKLTAFPENNPQMNIYAQFGKATAPLPSAGRTGYNFVGWKIENQGETLPIGSTTTEKDVTYYAQWEPIKYKVTFDANGGTCSFADKTVTFDGTYGTLPTAEREGYTFGGWTYLSSTVVNENSPLMENDNHELIAQWTPKRFSLYVDPNGGVVNGRDTSHEYGTLIYHSSDNSNINIPQRYGYVFSGYYTLPTKGVLIYDRNGQAQTSSYFDDESRYIGLFSLTVYAQWKAKTYKITLNPNGGECDKTEIMVSHDCPYGTLPTPTKLGSTFEGWTYKDAVVNEDSPLKTNEDHELVAKWRPIRYSLSIDPNGGSLNGNSSLREYGELYYLSTQTNSIPVPQRPGYDFVGYNTAPDGLGVMVYDKNGLAIPSDYFDEDLRYIKTFSLTVYAQWKIKTYKVQFNSNGGECDVTEKIYQYGDVYGILPTPQKTGATFEGWERDSEPVTSNSLVAQKDHILIAQWTTIPYTVTFVWNFDYIREGVNTNTSLPIYDNEMKVEYGKPYGTLPTPSKEGYTFLGWKTGQGSDGNGTGTSITSTTTVPLAKNHTLYAQWEQNTYEVTFDYNDD